jgi:hypothetical protein
MVIEVSYQTTSDSKRGHSRNDQSKYFEVDVIPTREAVVRREGSILMNVLSRSSLATKMWILCVGLATWFSDFRVPSAADGSEPSAARRGRQTGFDVNACHSTSVEYSAPFSSSSAKATSDGTISFRTFAIQKCFFNIRVTWHIDCAYSVSTTTKGGEPNEKHKITISCSDPSR